METLQSSPSRRRLSQPGKPPPLHAPKNAASPQKQKPLVITTDRSLHYMKPTSNSDAKKELFLVSLRNSQSGSDGKSLQQKFSSNSKASSISSKKPANTLIRSSSLNMVRTLTKTRRFKHSRASPRKSTGAAVSADMNAPERATCSSTLKDSKFPAYLMLNPGGTELEGTSVVKVCPYTYCSLNCHRHAPLPPLKSFISSSRCLLKTQKSKKLQALSSGRLKVPRETRKDSDIQKNVFDGKPAYGEAITGNPIITPLVQENWMCFFIEIYAKEKQAKPTVADEMGKFNSLKHLEDQEDIKSTLNKNGIEAGEDGAKQVIPSVPDAPPKPEIDLKEDFKKYFDDVAVEAYTKRSLLQEHNAEDADENHPPSWFCEEISTGSYCHEVSSDGEHELNIEMDDSNSQTTDIERDNQQIFALDHEEDIDSSVCTEETDLKIESLSESLYDVSVMCSDNILTSHYVDNLSEEKLQEANEEGTSFEAQPHDTNSVLEDTSGSTGYLSNGISCDQSSLIEEVFQHQTNGEHNDIENEKNLDDEASCSTKLLDEEAVENSQSHKISETREIDETCKESNSSLQNSDESISQDNQIHSSHVPDKSSVAVQVEELLEEDQGKANEFQSTSCIGGEEQNKKKKWKWASRRKRLVQDNDEMRKFNPREPNFLPFLPDPEPEKVYLKHQMMDERKNPEEWMLDFALRKAVTKLAPARKSKVALLVEAFETVMSIPKCETHIRNNSTFAHPRPIQARS